MPQAEDRLRAIFGITGGIEKAEKILHDYGFKIEDGWISFPDHDNLDEAAQLEAFDAIDYLRDEWDYAVKYTQSSSHLSGEEQWELDNNIYGDEGE